MSTVESPCLEAWVARTAVRSGGIVSFMLSGVPVVIIGFWCWVNEILHWRSLATKKYCGGVDFFV